MRFEQRSNINHVGRFIALLSVTLAARYVCEATGQALTRMNYGLTADQVSYLLNPSVNA